MPRSMHLHTEIYPNLKCISELFQMYTKSLDSFILASRTMESLGCCINAYEILLQNGWLLFFSRHTCNRFAETHSHLQLSYHITDRLLAAGNKHGAYYFCMSHWIYLSVSRHCYSCIKHFSKNLV